jgi:DNA-binding NarL/FixJ family response regulator
MGSAAAGGTREPGVVLLADDLSLVAVTPEAEHLLSLVEESRPGKLPLPVGVYTVAAALRAVEQGTALPWTVPATRIRTISGQWLSLHASRLQGPAGEQRITVVIKNAEPSATVPLLLSAYGLSPREGDVAKLVLRGTSTRAISSTLHISPHTVRTTSKRSSTRRASTAAATSSASYSARRTRQSRNHQAEPDARTRPANRVRGHAATQLVPRPSRAERHYLRAYGGCSAGPVRCPISVRCDVRCS